MRELTKKFFVHRTILVLAVLFQFQPDAAFGLSCPAYDPAELFEATDHAVVGRYLEHQFSDQDDGEFELVFLVEETLKGVPTDSIRLVGNRSIWLDPENYNNGSLFVIFVEPGIYRIQPCGFVFELKGRFLEWHESLE